MKIDITINLDLDGYQLSQLYSLPSALSVLGFTQKADEVAAYIHRRADTEHEKITCGITTT